MNWIVFLVRHPPPPAGDEHLVFRFLEKPDAEHCASRYRSWGWHAEVKRSSIRPKRKARQKV